MNLLDHKVTKILGEPEYHNYNGHGYYTIDVKANCYGREGVHTLVFKTKEKADKIQTGHIFQA